MRENTFRWLRHVLRRVVTEAIRLVKENYVDRKRGRERPKKNGM